MTQDLADHERIFDTCDNPGRVVLIGPPHALHTLSRKRAYRWVRKVARRHPGLFPHWGTTEGFKVGSLGAR
ncbi:hypothetical protein OAM69_05575 [bacterium]|nr:hypothetical protein [bacterium]